METKKFLWTLIKSFIVFGLSMVAMVVLPPVRRPFICNDIFLSYPRMKDTVGDAEIGIYGVFFPIIFIFITEIILKWKKFEDFQKVLSHSWITTKLLYGKYFIILCIGNILMTTTKISTGSHRPHFFETCQPDSQKNCTPGAIILNYKCTNPKLDGFWLEDGAMSFFSGHAQYAMYTSIFLVLYLKYRIKKLTLITPFIQALLISMGYFISISRVFDFRHWVVDVSVGGTIGTLQAIYVWFVQCKNLKFDEIEKEDNQVEESLKC